jgi:predicted dehydrogenase
VDTLFNVPDASSLNRLELYGSNGSIRAEGTIGQGDSGRMAAYFQESRDGYAARQERQESGDLSLSPEPVNTYRAEVEAFSLAVLEDSEPPVGAEQGLWIQKVIAACYESARTRRAVRL